jgi:hypothetical protein
MGYVKDVKIEEKGGGKNMECRIMSLLRKADFEVKSQQVLLKN